MALPEYSGIEIQNAMRVLCHSLGEHKLVLQRGDLVQLDGTLMRTQDATDELIKDRKAKNGTTKIRV